MEHLLGGVNRTGNLATDAVAILRHHGRDDVAEHVQRVAAEAERIARRLGADVTAATTAAWLHDISLVIPASDMLGAAESAGLDILPEERQVPVLLHGKLSAVIAQRHFGVQEPITLDAMRCHTTLRAGASRCPSSTPGCEAPFVPAAFAPSAFSPGAAPPPSSTAT